MGFPDRVETAGRRAYRRLVLRAYVTGENAGESGTWSDAFVRIALSVMRN